MHIDERYHLDIWTGLLHEALGWSEEQVTRWAARYREYLTDPDDIIYHANPIHWATWVLVPDALGDRLAPHQRANLEQKIRAVYHDEPPQGFDRNTDWKPYRERIEHVLAAYGEHLPVQTADG